ncbi:MAG: ABC transporter ATP-binding protein [Bacteroidales bacterium]|nr:ABC transporter ATP-binding protein [Bacteroidales bacterium]MCM1146926.1 ABC transporter ATP-binding protein [Bacteroidales bacterium]MCM1205576.1 ABC transporter ATP-binding protein [Bacillota bacterium]MCM1510313.1 ABC transporter ATP-binding protein [Clostridium sp.]
MNTLTISDLSIGHGRKTVASSLNASLAEGRLTCLVGRNGVGKSTLLRTLAGFLSPIQGKIEYTAPDGGENIIITPDRGIRHDAGRLARTVSVVLTGRPDVTQMTVREIVELGRSPYTDMWGTLRKKDREVAEKCMERTGVASLAERDIETLSDGECQKVLIAKALAQETPVILLDEPTAFLDYPSKVETMRLMKSISAEYSQGKGRAKGILLSTHDMEMALKLADEVWLMTQDRRLLCGSPSELEDSLVKENLKIIF